VFGVFVFVESYIISIEFKNCSDVVVFKFFFQEGCGVVQVITKYIGQELLLFFVCLFVKSVLVIFFDVIENFFM
jgi:hypothetical protein